MGDDARSRTRRWIDGMIELGPSVTKVPHQDLNITETQPFLELKQRYDELVSRGIKRIIDIATASSKDVLTTPESYVSAKRILADTLQVAEKKIYEQLEQDYYNQGGTANSHYNRIPDVQHVAKNIIDEMMINSFIKLFGGLPDESKAKVLQELQKENLFAHNSNIFKAQGTYYFDTIIIKWKEAAQKALNNSVGQHAPLGRRKEM